MTTLTLTADSTTDAAFRAWGGGISTAIAGLGLVKTSDTGQVNWTTVSKPNTTSVFTAYEVWRFDDALQATAPIYFKLDYGSNAGSATYPALRVTVGPGSDGAGTITGTYFPGVTANTSAIGFANHSNPWNGVATPTSVYVNGGTNALCLLLWPAFTSVVSSGAVLVIERTHNFDGTDNADGYSLYYNLAIATTTGSGGHVARSFLNNGFTPQSLPAVVAGQSSAAYATSSIINGTLYPTPMFTGYNVRLGAPSQWVMFYPRGDYGGNQTIAMTHYGVSRNWLTLGMGNSSGNPGWSATAAGHANSLLVRIS